MSVGAKFDDRQIQAYVKEFQKNINNDAVYDAVKRSFLKATGLSIAIIKKNSPVDTGLLRRSWHANRDFDRKNMSVEIYNSTDYAIYVEKGHRTRGGGGFVEGQFFLERSIPKMQRLITKLVKEAYEDALKKLLGE